MGDLVRGKVRLAAGRTGTFRTGATLLEYSAMVE